jgi:hypothetical protein
MYQKLLDHLLTPHSINLLDLYLYSDRLEVFKFTEVEDFWILYSYATSYNDIEINKDTLLYEFTKGHLYGLRYNENSICTEYNDDYDNEDLYIDYGEILKCFIIFDGNNSTFKFISCTIDSIIEQFFIRKLNIKRATWKHEDVKTIKYAYPYTNVEYSFESNGGSTGVQFTILKKVKENFQEYYLDEEYDYKIIEEERYIIIKFKSKCEKKNYANLYIRNLDISIDYFKELMLN